MCVKLLTLGLPAEVGHLLSAGKHLTVDAELTASSGDQMRVLGTLVGSSLLIDTGGTSVPNIADTDLRSVCLIRPIRTPQPVTHLRSEVEDKDRVVEVVNLSRRHFGCGCGVGGTKKGKPGAASFI